MRFFKCVEIIGKNIYVIACSKTFISPNVRVAGQPNHKSGFIEPFGILLYYIRAEQQRSF